MTTDEMKNLAHEVKNSHYNHTPSQGIQWAVLVAAAEICERLADIARAVRGPGLDTGLK